MKCKHIIEELEYSQHEQSNNKLKCQIAFTEINVNMFSDWKEYSDIIFPKLRQVVDKDTKDVNIDSLKQWPEKFGFEQIRFKKYEPNNEDEFQTHVDVTNYNSARRFLVFFMYLNNNDGGETTFPDYDISVKPEAGKLILFPPFWTHEHRGVTLQKGIKYIATTWIVFK